MPKYRTLARVVAFAPAILMAACANPTSPLPQTAPANIVADVQLLTTTAETAWTTLEQADPNLIPAQDAAIITQSLQGAADLGKQLNTNMSATDAANKVEVVEGYVNSVLQTLASPDVSGKLPGQYQQVFLAVDFLMPELEAYVNTVLGPQEPAQPPAPAAAAFHGQTMTQDQARQTLRSWTPPSAHRR